MDVKDDENRRLIFIVMNKILTLDEKKYLNRVCNYLGSLGMSSGVITFQLEYDQVDISEEDINWNYITAFDNNYRAEIPQNLYPILKKIIGYIIDNKLFNSPDIAELTNQGMEIEIVCKSKEIMVSNWYSYYEIGEGSSLIYDTEDDINRFEMWADEDLREVEVPEDGILTISYNGGGDSGYIEPSFNGTFDAVPNRIEDWCYRELESNFGGWEMYEGSDGQFIFNFNNFTVELEHRENVETSGTNTLFEEKFGL